MIDVDYWIDMRDPFGRESAVKIVDYVANYVVTMAKALVPVRTGLLQSSIHIDYSRSYETETEAVRYVVASAKYAAVVEYGRTSRAPFPGRFYMRRAVEETARFIEQYLPYLSYTVGGRNWP